MIRAPNDARDWERIRRSTRGIVEVPQHTVTADYAVQGTDVHVIVDAGAPVTITLPPADAWVGRDLVITNVSSHAVVIASDARPLVLEDGSHLLLEDGALLLAEDVPDPISGAATTTLSAQWASVTLRAYPGGWLML